MTTDHGTTDEQITEWQEHTTERPERWQCSVCNRVISSDNEKQRTSDCPQSSFTGRHVWYPIADPSIGDQITEWQDFRRQRLPRWTDIANPKDLSR